MPSPLRSRLDMDYVGHVCNQVNWWLFCYINFFFFQGACVKKLSGTTKLEDNRAIKQVVALLSAPLEKYDDIVTALTLSNYPRVMDHLDNGTNKVMAVVIIQSIMKNNSCISTADKVCFFYLFYFTNFSSYNVVYCFL